MRRALEEEGRPRGRPTAGGSLTLQARRRRGATLDRRERTVRNVQIDSHPRSEADAHALAVRWAEEWDLSREPFDRWRDGETKTPAISSARPAERIGDGGPVPVVEVRNSFQDENPVLVSLQFYWPD